MESINNNNNKITLEMSNDEALVLLNWLFRFNETNNGDAFEDQSEERVLWDMESVLEKVISETFSGDYRIITKSERYNKRQRIKLIGAVSNMLI